MKTFIYRIGLAVGLTLLVILTSGYHNANDSISVGSTQAASDSVAPFARFVTDSQIGMITIVKPGPDSGKRVNLRYYIVTGTADVGNIHGPMLDSAAIVTIQSIAPRPGRPKSNILVPTQGIADQPVLVSVRVD